MLELIGQNWSWFLPHCLFLVNDMVIEFRWHHGYPTSQSTKPVAITYKQPLLMALG